ncbi:MAG: hypothetical protein HKO83_11590 [Ignavibacteriaceae bacterium]|nr:hypothetical protein [Ignavibacteriaceae bacterium]
MLVPQIGKIFSFAYRNKRNILIKSTILLASLKKYNGRIVPVLKSYFFNGLVVDKGELCQACRDSVVLCRLIQRSIIIDD